MRIGIGEYGADGTTWQGRQAGVRVAGVEITDTPTDIVPWRPKIDSVFESQQVGPVYSGEPVTSYETPETGGLQPIPESAPSALSSVLPSTAGGISKVWLIGGGGSCSATAEAMTNAFQQPWGMGSLRADIGSEDFELESMLNSGGGSTGGGYTAQTGGYAGGAATALLNPNGSTAQRLVMAAPQIAGATIAGSAAFGSAWATAAIPIVGPIITGVTVGLTLLFARKGPRQKVATTSIVDKVEPLLAENVQGYLNGNRSRQAYEQAVENFNAGWQFVVERCGIPEMGNPGQNCITERQRGGRWDWFKLYLDPILENAPLR